MCAENTFFRINVSDSYYDEKKVYIYYNMNNIIIEFFTPIFRFIVNCIDFSSSMRLLSEKLNIEFGFSSLTRRRKITFD